MGDFKKLRVWQEAMELVVEIYKLTNEELFAKDYGLKDQIRRAAVSIVSNIAEGDELKTQKQSIQFFYIAKGSAAEVNTQLIIANAVGYLGDSKMNELEDKTMKISSMLYKLIEYRSIK